MGGRFALLAALAVAAVVGGCASVDGFADRGVAYNREIASAQDRTLFLNVVRAAYRRPMAFTSITGVSGTASFSGTLGFTLPFADNPHLTAFQAAPSLGASSGPTFQIANLDTQEFIKGFLAPVSAETVNLFGEEGLPWQELFELMIAEASVTDETGATVRLLNRPGVREAEFQGFIAALRDADVRTEAIETKDVIGPSFAPADPHALDGADKASAAGFHLGRQPGGAYRWERSQPGFRLCVGAADAKAIHFRVGNVVHRLTVSNDMRCGHAAANSPSSPGTQAGEAPAGRALLAPAARPAGSRGLAATAQRIDVVFRSAEGVTYFLGEVARQDLCLEPGVECGAPPVTIDWPDGERQRLFRVERGPARATDVADVSFLGQGFRLVGGQGDRSAQVLTILGQLVALNRSAKDNPAPGVVTLVGH